MTVDNKIMLGSKLNKLAEILREYQPILVAYSGGVDSTFLLAFAYKTFSEKSEEGDQQTTVGDKQQTVATVCSQNSLIGKSVYESVSALTAAGPQFAKDETEYAENLCERLGISHKKIDASHIINMIKRNPIDRCYHCKRELFGMLKSRADMVGSVLVDGTNADDMDDYRPGYKAICELGIRSPLKEAGLTKAEIRQALAELQIGDAREMAEHPAFACLTTRIPYGETITEQKLQAVYEAEQFLKAEGFKQVRVRCHEIAGKVSGNETRFMARIELENADVARLLAESPIDNATEGDKNTTSSKCKGESSKNITLMTKTERALRELGFEYVTIDLGGYAKGKMNRALQGAVSVDAAGKGAMQKPDRIKVTETAHRGNAKNAETADVMAEIDRFLKETSDKEYSFGDFIDIIEKLRQPGGCPWDREQTHESLKKHMVEEVNEALDAIDEKDWQHLCEELGDVLLQIVLHAQIASEEGEFTIDDVVQCASEKMIRRHPHVFGNIDVSGVDEGLDLWEEIKKREKMAKK